MKQTQKNLIDRLNHLLLLSDKVLQSKYFDRDGFEWVNHELFQEFKTSCLSFILNIYTNTHPYYIQFNEVTQRMKPSYVQNGRGILKSIKSEIENGWLSNLTELISAEIFSDFFEMADHLLQENYKDPAAVMIGSVLEEHIRYLCKKNNIDVDEIKSGKNIPKKADLLNAELAKANIYNKLDQKNITAWLDLRNKAAHGKYEEYTKSQVEILLNSVSEFIARNK